MSGKSNNFKLWIPMSLLGINIIFCSFVIEELIDASPNYGGLGFLMPIIGVVSLIYIKNNPEQKRSSLIYILQAMNLFFIVSPGAILVLFMLAFL